VVKSKKLFASVSSADDGKRQPYRTAVCPDREMDVQRGYH
jgi:hypothetical protein